ncbi:hypothetical protein [Tateyamaria sp. SN3-11]|uniref:hypothetical protein n=1 Tax=Tateyamaria sp. SN3-11 TaxID=3092147 RepID=UPI0039EBC10B
MIQLMDDDSMRIQMVEAAGDYALVAFTGIGHSLGGLAVQRPEFLSLCSLGKVLWVTDKKRTWGNGIDIDQMVSTIAEATCGKTVFAIGNSMGGFLAILMSRLIGARRVLAFSPQWSVSPDIVPDETRWAEFTRHIAHFHYPDLSEAFADDCHYAVICGDHPKEQLHTQFFNAHRSDTVEVHELLGETHNVALALKERGILGRMLIDYFNGAIPLDQFFDSHGVIRT